METNLASTNGSSRLKHSSSPERGACVRLRTRFAKPFPKRSFVGKTQFWIVTDRDVLNVRRAGLST